MSQLQGYLIPIIIHFCIEIVSSAVNVLLNVTENLPHTAARYQHWLYLISDDNLDHWDLQRLLLVALLPAYMILLWDRIDIRFSPQMIPRRTFESIEHALLCSFVASWIWSIFVMLYIGWSVPPGRSKLMTWIDLCLESSLTALITWSLCWIPWCLSSLAFGWEEFIDEVQALLHPAFAPN